MENCPDKEDNKIKSRKNRSINFMPIKLKFKKHIEKVWRMKPEENTRFDKIRLDKNERISPFPYNFWNKTLLSVIVFSTETQVVLILQ